MSNIVGIVNYGAAGNLHSVEKALKKAKEVTKEISDTTRRKIKEKKRKY